jgi:hypothetical protein
MKFHVVYAFFLEYLNACLLIPTVNFICSDDLEVVTITICQLISFK